MTSSVSMFFDFVRRSPTAFHATATAANALDAAGFIRLGENEAWNIVPGGKYYATRNNSTLIAFSVPERGFAPFQIVASHSDSPTFKLKPIAEENSVSGYVRLNVEPYGGMIMSSWFDKPLSIAGRVMLRRGNKIETKLVNLDRNAVLIPNLPIHFNRDVNDGYKYNPQVDLLPMFGGADARGELKAELAHCTDADPEEVVAYDLYLYNRTDGCTWGARNEFFSCPRIDDLECVYASLRAFLSADPTCQNITVCAIFDNEEVGSTSKQGADSSFLTDILFRACASLGATSAETRAAIASSFMVSADNAHAVHPNHSEKYDQLNRTYMNGGVVIKHNARQKYTTDAVSDAVFSAICERAGVPVQHFSNRSDMRGGSTLGNIANSQVSMNTVDIGVAQLAMHSCYETAGCADLDAMTSALTAFYETTIVMESDGEFSLK